MIKLSSLRAWAIFALSALVLSGCSEPKKVRVPDALPAFSSPYSLSLNWQIQTSAFNYSDSEGLAFAETPERVYFAAPSGELTAAKKQPNGRWVDQIVWQRKYGESIVAGPTLVEKSVLVGTSKGSLLRVSQKNGEIEWQAELSSEVLSRPLVTDADVLVRTVDGKLYSINAATGTVNWVAEHTLPSLSLRGVAPLTYHDGIIYVGWESGKVEAIDAATGEVKWQTQVVIPRGRTDLERLIDIQAQVVLSHGRLYVLAYHGKLVALNPENGNLYWSKDYSGYRDFLIDDKALYLIDEDDILRAFDLYNGTELWRRNQLKYRQLTDLQFYGKDQIVVGDGYGYLHWFDKIDGTLVARAEHTERNRLGETIARIKVSDRKIFVMDTHGFVTSYTVVPSDWYEFNRPGDPLKLFSSSSTVDASAAGAL